jgi:glycosyltransferase involved in cell wall biosynthesis
MNLSKGFIQQSHQVIVVVYGQNEDEVYEENGIQFYKIKNVKLKGLSLFLTQKKIEKLINKLISENKIDIIEAPDWTGITAFMNLNAPVIIRFHGSDTYFCYLENRKQKIKNFWLEKRGIYKAQGFIAPTTFVGDLSRELFGIKNKKIQTIPHGLELDKFTNPNPEKFEKGSLLYIGTIIRKKGVLELPSIFNKVRKHYPEAKLILIGNDSYDINTNSISTWELLKNEFENEDFKQVSYLGKIPYQDVKEYIINSNVCVFPTFAETFGMVTIEAMALQKPVVNSNIGWANEIIDDEINGYLVHPKNHNEFANKILELLSNNDMQYEFGISARKKVEEQFNIELTTIKSLEFYKETLQLYNLHKNSI